MDPTSFRSFAACLVMLFVSVAQAEPLEQRLERTFDELRPHYLGHESVRTEAEPTPKKYLLLDFRFESSPEGEQLQQQIHRICMALLRNREMVQQLSEAQYHMVSVAFNRRYQYDCLP